MNRQAIIVSLMCFLALLAIIVVVAMAPSQQQGDGTVGQDVQHPAHSEEGGQSPTASDPPSSKRSPAPHTPSADVVPELVAGLQSSLSSKPTSLPVVPYEAFVDPLEPTLSLTGLPAPVARMVDGAEEIDSRDLEPDEQGRPGRVRLVRAEGFKYPHLRVVDRFTPMADGRLNPMPESMVSVASHVMIMVDRDIANEDLEAAVAQAGGALLQRHPHSRVALVQVPEVHVDAVPEMIAALSGQPLILAAENDYVVGTLDDPDPIVPNDPAWPLWGMQKVGADKAWNLTRGSHQVVVGVIDTGINYNHPDLIANAYINPNESADESDSDDNGFIDDVRGWNFVNNTNDPMDGSGHGTHVAGTIGAMGNNEIGVVGVAWDVQLMGLRIFGNTGGGATSDAVRAVEYSTMMGVDITNNSWGGGAFSESLYAAIEEARDAGILFIAAAGNSKGSMPFYPARYGHANPGGGKQALSNVISVGATNSKDELATFSNRQAHIAAPGVDINSTIITGYDRFDGTSMASPHVAGAAALMLSLVPDLQFSLLREWLMTSADVIPALEEVVESGLRLNIYRFLIDNINQAYVVMRGSSVDDGNNGNGIIEPGETVSMIVRLGSIGAFSAENVTAILSTSSDYIHITQATASYGDIPLSSDAGNAANPYVFTVDADTPTPYTITFYL